MVVCNVQLCEASWEPTGTGPPLFLKLQMKPTENIFVFLQVLYSSTCFPEVKV